MMLTVAIPSIVERGDQLQAMLIKMNAMLERDGLTDQVEIITMVDNRELTIGEKRERLYKMAKGKYTVQVDDDDDISDWFFTDVIEAAKHGYDCIGYREHVNMYGQVLYSEHSIKHKKWEQFRRPVDGVLFARTPFCKTPILTSICQEVGVKHMRFGEDHDFAIRVYDHLNSEYFIPKVMYIYNAPILRNNEDFKKRYGNI